MQTELMDAESANKFIQRLVQARPKDSEEVRKFVPVRYGILRNVQVTEREWLFI